MSRVFEARYGGRCGICDTEIYPGDDVCYEDDEVIHWDCRDDVIDGDDYDTTVL